MVSRPLGSRRAEAEAAAWIARLQASDRGAATEAGLQDWLRADPVHAAAFERATEIWTMLPGAAMCSGANANVTVLRSARPRAWASQRRLRGLAASVALLVSVGAGWWMLDRPADYVTRLGEQKVATLEDGSRIALNTDSEVEVRYAPGERRVTLDRGEAMFEVAPNHERPFIVTAGDKQVRALGTSFIVRRTGGGVVVTLLEGKVSVTDIHTAKIRPTILAPGERLTANGDAPSTIDQPAIDAVTAWRRGQAVFADTPLSAAVAELNRYGGPRIAVDDPHLASLRISGVFATNDTSEFAAAIAALHGLRVQRTSSELRIVR